MNRRTVGVLLAATLAAVGCAKSKTYRFTDTEGRLYTVTCKSGGGHYDARCSVGADFTPKPTDTAPANTHAGLELEHTANNRYVTVCAVWAWNKSNAFATATAYDCRAITCRADGDCPEAPLLEHPSCINGLCGDPNGSIRPNDVTALCLAGTGPWTGSDEQRKRATAALESGPRCAHGAYCTVPPACRQP